MHILLNTSISKDNQIMKFDQLTDKTLETSSLRNHTQNVVEKQFPDPFLKNQN